MNGRLAAAANMYPWSGTRPADLGVITLPELRGRGLARASVLAMAADPLEGGYEPQHQCAVGGTGLVIRVPPLRGVDRHRRLTPWRGSR